MRNRAIVDPQQYFFRLFIDVLGKNRDCEIIIEDDVVIGAGAVILNNIYIGRGAKIGANAVVTCDITGGIAIGAPDRLINESTLAK